MKTEFTLFSQMYSCYYQVVRHILSQASGNFLTKQQMKETGLFWKKYRPLLLLLQIDTAPA